MLYRTIVTLVLVLCFTLPSHATNLKKLDKDLTFEFARDLKKFNIPGAAYVIVKDNKVFAQKTFGYLDKNRKQKINSQTVFRLASVSKPFAATITAMLAQENQLKLSDPITKYVPNFELAQKGAADKIQLKHILSHSSGLMPNTYDNLLHENWSMNKIVGRFDRLTPICKPAKCYGYQNIAYGMLQPAIEASQSKSYEELLQQRVFTPLKMKNASLGIDEFKANTNTAKPHVLRKTIKTKQKDSKGKRIKKYVWSKVKVTPDYYKVPTAAGVNASIADMGKWLIANLGHQPDILSPKLLKELTTPRIKTKKDLRRSYWRNHLTDAHYGYGWRIYKINGKSVIYHSGWVSGYRADIGYSPELGIGFAVLMNAEANLINKVSSDFWEKIHSSI